MAGRQPSPATLEVAAEFARAIGAISLDELIKRDRGLIDAQTRAFRETHEAEMRRSAAEAFANVLAQRYTTRELNELRERFEAGRSLPASVFDLLERVVSNLIGVPREATMLDQEQAAKLLGISPRSVSRLPLPKVKVGKSVRYRREDLDHYIAERRLSPQRLEPSAPPPRPGRRRRTSAKDQVDSLLRRRR